jgi:bifunctional non-homologous end joining protein LigD
MPLDEYRRKRDFTRTPEPSGDQAADAAGGLFCIQRHDARRLHYDVRLELDGVLKSWAVPKGPSLDPEEKRLAVHVEDHPLDYGEFEGAIPAGEYGAGDVVLWDIGRWTPIGDARDGYAKGKLKFTLAGRKLRGAWTLARMGGRASEGGKNWLLLKERDAEARESGQGDVLAERPESVNSLMGDAPLPERVEPQLAVLADAAPSGDDWLHEIKYDGYRALCRIDHGNVRLFTRAGLDWTERFHGVAAAAAALPAETALLDGEVVVLTPDGRTSFDALQHELGAVASNALSYVVFDVLHLDGVDLRPLPLEARKVRLADLLRRVPAGGVLRYCDHVVGRGPDFLRHAAAHGLEGVMSKRRDRPHRPGRGDDWRKIRCTQRQEFVVGGFTEGAGARIGFGALLLGVYDDAGTLIHVGRVGTGFDDAKLEALRARLDAMMVPASPFAPFTDVPKEVHWVRPELVAEVGFTSWTRDGRLRHPLFLGLREDRDARDVRREEVAGAPPPPADGPVEPCGVRLTHPDRVLWPEVGVTKVELAHYYVAVGERMLGYMSGRPLAIVRGPRGHTGTIFFQKHAADGLPDAIRSVPIDDEDGLQRHVMVDSVAGLVGLVQVDTLEIHSWGSRGDDIEHPDRIVIDLDPDPSVPWEVVCAAAAGIRLRLEHLELESFVKTTGGKGLHVVVPFERADDWPAVKTFARAICEDVVRRLPAHFTVNPQKADRVGKIYLDYLRNGRGATAVAAYSARARPGAPVSWPLDWDELAAGVDASALTVRTVLERLDEPDPWAGFGEVRQTITRAMRRAVGLPR